jgi:hypothetical protein
VNKETGETSWKPPASYSTFFQSLSGPS